MSTAIAIQAFNKADSVLGTLESIVRARGSKDYDLFVLQDGFSGSNQTEKYCAAWAETSQALKSWISKNRDHFAAVHFENSDQNNGPYQTAERLITWALETSSGEDRFRFLVSARSLFFVLKENGIKSVRIRIPEKICPAAGKTTARVDALQEWVEPLVHDLAHQFDTRNESDWFKAQLQPPESPNSHAA